MPLPSVSVPVAPEATLTTLGFVAGGIYLGTISGPIPGLHANNFALYSRLACRSSPARRP
ncbi:hypothetical protein [Haladaptatus sp. QDMS2]|nr:hypothetical protein [Haladaptatus sp. QDMS2]